MATINKTVAEINQSLDFADELRQLKNPEQINQGIDKANKSKRKPFASVEAMSLDDSIDIGEVVRTVSYYDGWAAEVKSPVGGNSYIKVAGQAPEDDRGSIIYSNDGNHFKGLFPHNYCEPEQWGAFGDGVKYDSAALIACNLSEYSDIRYSDKTYYVNQPIPFPSRKKFRGVKGKTIVKSDAPNQPVGCSQSYLSSEGVSPTGYLDIDDIIFEGDIDNIPGQVAFMLRDFYSNIGPGCIFRNTRGGGLHILATDDNEVSVGGTLVENKIKGITIRNVGGIAALLGGNDNKVTDGYFTDCVVASNNTYGTQAIVCNNAAGWNIKGWHTYGKDMSTPVDIKNCFNTKIDGYIESFTDVAAAINIQRNTQATLRVKTTNGVVSDASAVVLSRSGAYPDANIKLDLALNHQNGDVDLTGVSILQNEIIADVNVNLSGQFKDRVRKISYSNINQYENTNTINANIRGRFSDNTQDLNSFEYNGNTVSYGSSSNKVINAFSETFKLPKMRNFKKTIIDISILANRFDNGGGIDAYYVGKIFISAKNNGSDSWTALLFDVVAPMGFSANPSVSINQLGDDEAEITVSGTFSSSEYTGVVSVILPPPHSPSEFT